jgi:hypothetical protein
VSLLGIEKARARLVELKEQAVAALAPFKPNEEMLVHAAEFVVARKF